MSSMYGADVEQLRTLAKQFDDIAQRLDAGRMSVGNAIQISAWIGPFAATFRLQWESDHSKQLSKVATALQENALILRANATAQETTSAAGTGHWYGTADWPTREQQNHDWLATLPRTKESWRDSIKHTNPHYADFMQNVSEYCKELHLVDSSGEYRNNCGYASIAYDMRRRGYDVTAAPDLDGDTCASIASAYVDPTTGQSRDWTATGSESATSDAVKGFGDGARAIVWIGYAGGGGHFFIAENMDGQVRFLDPQSGEVDVNSHFKLADSGKVAVLRIDDQEPNMNPMKYLMVEPDGN